MTRFVLHLVLALVWCLLTGSANPWNFVAGVLVGGAVVSVYSRVTGQGGYFSRVMGVIGFAWYFAVILTKANIDIARALLNPKPPLKPRILRYNVAHLTNAQKTTLANAITLTPGTLVVDICPTGDWLYLHCMFAEQRESVLEEIEELERKLMKGVF
jgi:multicomponent Na+:H+ antiporter subunit E